MRCACKVCAMGRRAELGETIERAEIESAVREAMQSGRVQVLGDPAPGLTDDDVVAMLVEGIAAQLGSGPRPGDDDPPPLLH